MTTDQRRHHRLAGLLCLALLLCGCTGHSKTSRNNELLAYAGNPTELANKIIKQTSYDPLRCTVQYAFDVKKVYLDGKVEMKSESDTPGVEWSTAIDKPGYYVYEAIDLGPWSQNQHWIWWDTLRAEVELKVYVNGVLVISGTCDRNQNGEALIKKTLTTSIVYNPPGDIFLQEHKNITYIKKRTNP